MTKNTRSPVIPKSKSVGRKSIFGPAPIIEGEDAEAYDKLLKQVLREVKPRDTIEEIFVHDVVDLTWEIWRWRRLKTSLVSYGMESVLQKELELLVRENEAPDDLAKKWVQQRPAALKRVDKLLSSANITIAYVMALAFNNEIEDLERLDRLATIAEGRRNAALHEIERHRAALAQALQSKIAEIEDAEFETIEPKGIEQRNVA